MPEVRTTDEWRPSANPWLITAAVMLATFMEILDTTIVTVAVPHIAGSLSASNTEATWVLTSYLVSNAVILPASGWFAIRFGRKRFLITCIVIFTLTSIISGAAFSLGMLVVARILQGAGGGALQPLSQAILLESFPPEKRGMAMAAFALGVVVAPIAGPTIGGWLTDNLSWRWAFYINIPVGVCAVLMIHAFVEDPPYIRNAKAGKIDYIGFGLMAVALGTLQIMLDKGQEDDWFSAPWIRWFAVTSFVSMIAFIVWELRVKEPIVRLRIFTNRNFLVGTFLIMLVGVVLYSAITLIPLYLQTLMGYTALQSGTAVSTRGVGALLAMPIVGFLTGRVDFRKLIGCGFLLVALSLWIIGDLNLEITMTHIALPSMLTGVGLAMMFVPLATVAMGTLPQSEMGNASGIFNLMRNIGGSAGIALLTTFLTRRAQANQSTIIAHLSALDSNFSQRLNELQSFLSVHVPAVEAGRQAKFIIYDLARQQSQLLAFVQTFHALAIISVLCIAATLFLKKIRPKEPATPSIRRK
ncbi:MAG TPA: DHA2 family efflux MFS transporter permease subunit [Dissulfurispiraceae bacterium]|nr:DHA2 family efflux MFS transporter permease subunit [Dissulfurispiraceae bacterium]